MIMSNILEAEYTGLLPGAGLAPQLHVEEEGGEVERQQGRPLSLHPSPTGALSRR